VALAFPLHPPGRPERTRVAELTEAGVPTLVIQGERDPFGGPAEFPAGTRITGVPWADHSFGVPARAGLTPGAVTDLIVAAVLDWWPAR
jgi:predicted alpha/beta-hydrolase family hydrolase